MSRARLLALLSVLFVLPAVAKVQGDFTIVVLPDTQNYSANNPAIFNTQTQWIADNASALNIQFVLHEGDIVDLGGDTAQWANADAAMKILDGKVPYVAAIGNHDYDTKNVSLRTAYTTYYNQYFGPSRYAGTTWYRGSYQEGSNENSYSVFNVAGKEFLVVALEVYPRDAVLDWANSVISANPDKEVIVLTHAYMFGDDTRIGRCDQGGKSDLKVPNDNDGDGMWQKLVRKHANVSLVLSGHIVWNGGIGRRADLGDHGNLVNQVLADFQNYANGGNGYLRVLTFHPATNSIDVTTYSPWLNKSLTDARNQFTLKWHADESMAGQPSLVSGRVRSDVDCKFVTDATVVADDANTTTDANAIFSLSTMTQNPTFTASALGWLSGTMQVIAPSGAGAQAEFFLTPAGKIAGTVVDPSGLPISGATVEANGGLKTTTATMTSDEHGAFMSDWISAGNYTVTASKTGVTSSSSAIVPGKQTASVTLTLDAPPATSTFLSGTITNATSGSPIANVTVTAGSESTITSSAGHYSFSTLPPGTYTVTASKSGWGKQSITVALTNGSAVTADIKLATSGRIAGTVTRADGSPIVGAVVTFTGGVINNTTSVSTRSTGAFTSSYIPVGSYSVTATAKGFEAATLQTSITAGSMAQLSFVLSSSSQPPPPDGKASLNGRVVSAINGAAISGVTVTLGSSTAMTDSSGRYSFSSITPATYTICATKSGWGHQCASTTLVSGANTTPDIRLATSGRITGTVKNASGTSLSGATVTFTGGVINNTTSVSTSSSGSYTSAYIPVGDYAVTVTKSGFASRTGNATVTTGGKFVLNFTM